MWLLKRKAALPTSSLLEWTAVTVAEGLFFRSSLEQSSRELTALCASAATTATALDVVQEQVAHVGACLSSMDAQVHSLVRAMVFGAELEKRLRIVESVTSCTYYVPPPSSFGPTTGRLGSSFKRKRLSKLSLQVPAGGSV